MQNGVARAQKREQGGGNGRHAAGEDRGALRLVPDRQAILKDLEVGVVETRIDEAGLLTGARLTAAGRQIEKVLALLRIFKTNVEVRRSAA